MKTLRQRLVLCAIMGGVPLLLAIAIFVARVEAIIESDNAKKLADVVIAGGVITVILALIAVIHVLAETYVQDKE